MSRGIKRSGEGEGWKKRFERNVAIHCEYQWSFPEGYQKKNIWIH